MADQPPSLPGMYFDPEKKKYFRIPRSGAMPADHTHSAESIRKRLLEEEAAADQRRVAALNYNRIDRFLIPYATRDVHQRELGFDRTPSTLMYHYLGNFDHFQVHGRNGRVTYRNQAFADGIPPPSLVRPSAYEVEGTGAFDVSMKHSTLLWHSNDYGTGTLLASELDTRATVRDGDSPHLRRPTNVFMAESSIYSIDIHHETDTVLTTWKSAGEGPNMHITKLEGPCLFQLGSDHCGRFRTCPHHGGRGEERYQINSVSLGKKDNQYAFMVGGNMVGVAGYDVATETWTQMGEGVLNNPENEIFGLEMLEDDPHMVVVGQRSGQFRMWDMRQNMDGQALFDGNHVSSICKIKDMGCKKIVVTGLQNTMSVYDLRNMKPGNRVWKAEDIPNCPTAHAQGDSYTMPYTWMPGYKNRFERKADVAVDRTTGLIAAGQGEGSRNHVRIFNMHEASTIADFDCRLQGGRRNREAATCIRWIDDDDQKGENALKSLWFSKGPAMYTARWGAAGDPKLGLDEVEQTAA